MGWEEVPDKVAVMKWLSLISLLPYLAFCSPDPFSADTSNVPISVQQNLKGQLRSKFTVTDKKGRHILTLSRDSSRLATGSDKIVLQASQFLASGNNWKQEWVINDNITCAGLDLDADFILPLTSFSDLDSNGISETTVAYHLACLGGIDPKPTKAIIRQGKMKYAARGESLVQIEGAAPFGGKFTLEPNLDKSPAFKEHLVTIWKKAAGVLP